MKRVRSRSHTPASDRRRSPDSLSPRRSLSSQRSRSPAHYSDIIDKIRLTDADAAFILGKGGKTKEKIARVSGASVELPPRSLVLEITGSTEERRKAKKYVECVMAQRSGDVVLDENDPHFQEDCTIVEVPSECAGFVTGANGSFLRAVEQEYCTIMFFVRLRGDGGRRNKDFEKLVIFGARRGRRGSELKVLAAIENKLEGYLTKHIKEKISSDPDWGTDIKKLKMDEMSWALGRKGATRKKLARASGCIVEYIGNYVHMSGTGKERSRAGEYLQCIMDQLGGPVTMPTEGRDDVTVLSIPQDCVGYVTGLRRSTLSRIEDDSGAFMLFMDNKEESFKKEIVKLGIFGVRRNRRAAELKVMSTVEGKTPGFFTKGVKEGIENSEWGTDIYRFRGEEFSYALGKDGNTKKKLARASGCIIEYLGDFAFMSGTRKERGRALRYLKWLLKQRSGAVRVDELDLEPRQEDVKQIDIPAQAIAYVMGPKGSGLRAIEEETNTFLFMARDRSGTDVLMICGGDKNDRRHAEHAIHSAVNDYDRGGGRPGETWSDSDHERDRRDDYGPPAKYARDDRSDRGDRYDRYDRDDRDGGRRSDDRGGYGDDRGGYGGGSRRGRRSRSRSYTPSRSRSRGRRHSRDRDWRGGGGRDRH